MPKDSVVDQPALKSLERLEEKVLDSNLNISMVFYLFHLFHGYMFQKLDDIANMAAKGDQKEAARMIEEIKEQQEEQVRFLLRTSTSFLTFKVKLIKKQGELVDELNKHVEKHKIGSLFDRNIENWRFLANSETEDKNSKNATGLKEEEPEKNISMAGEVGDVPAKKSISIENQHKLNNTDNNNNISQEEVKRSV